MKNAHTPTTAPLIYLAEAIDRAQGPGRDGFSIIRGLSSLGATTYRPATTWQGGQHNPVLVEKTNREVLYSSDAILADLSSDTRTIGVPSEIEAATARGIPAVVLWHDQPRSVVLQANPQVHWADSWPEAVGLAYKLAEQHWAGSGRGVDNLLRVVLSGEEAPPLSRAYDDDAGIDLVTSETTVIEPGAFIDVPTHVVGTQLPGWSWGLVVGRSSSLRKRGLLVSPGVIDAGWRGPLFAGAMNMTAEPVKVEAGERIAQLIIMNNDTARVAIQQVDELHPHARGLRGFGSTG